MVKPADRPTLYNWITCDAVHVDPATGKHTLLGLFNGIVGRQFPLTHPGMVWFLTIGGLAAGKHKLRLSVGREDEPRKPIAEREFESHDPRQRINLVNELRGFPFPAPGTYWIEIGIDDDTLVVVDLPVVREGPPPASPMPKAMG